MSSFADKTCPVCEAEIEKKVYNNYGDWFDTIENLVEVINMDRGDNEILNRVKREAYSELREEIEGVRPELIIKAMQDFAKTDYSRDKSQLYE